MLAKLLCLVLSVGPAAAWAAGDNLDEPEVDAFAACVESGLAGDPSVGDLFGMIPVLSRKAVLEKLKKDKKCPSKYPSDESEACAAREACLSAAVEEYRKTELPKIENLTDDKDKLLSDILRAVDAYETITGKEVSYKDDQQFVSWDFYMRQGEANLNPDRRQTATLQYAVMPFIERRKLTQAELIHEAILAADGNATLGIGSLAELICWQRSDLIPRVEGIENREGKTYYRFAGAFIGFHGEFTSRLGETAAMANILGNPIVYSAAEIGKWWVDLITEPGSQKAVDSVETFKTRSKYGAKAGEMHMGLAAARAIRKGKVGFQASSGVMKSMSKESLKRSRKAIGRTSQIDFGPIPSTPFHH